MSIRVELPPLLRASVKSIHQIPEGKNQFGAQSEVLFGDRVIWSGEIIWEEGHHDYYQMAQELAEEKIFEVLSDLFNRLEEE